ncbi:MAG: xanthine dehydrogenase family protein molybdopterin-binding subunit [Candidatus Poribacteria bacterium]|nr:xanthine dehydrogenase family protein molybdopterin-binding subunit [Candidatus Poribacteria bacterium]
MSEKKEYKVIGTRPIRHDGVDKVTGRALYGADFQTTGLLHGKVLRSRHAHARIKSIDTSRAEAHPDVKAVVTAADLPTAADKIADLGESAVNLKYLCDNILASDKALYTGHAVAALAASDPHTAEEALELIDVEYEVLPPVLEVREAMEDDAPLLHENLKTDAMGEKSEESSNVASHFQHKKGDIDTGFAEADVVIEHDFVTGTVHQGYIEPHNATALYNPDGQLTIWCSTQGAFAVRQQVSEILQIPVSKVKVVPMEIGGGFGGKISVYLEPVAALLSKKSGRPVKVLMNRAEVFEATGPTPASYIRVKMGVTNDGRITAAEGYLAFEAGAYPGSPVGAGAMCIFSPYNIPNGLIDGYDVVVNKPKSNAYRAPGATNAEFAAETVVDEICEKLGMDPLEFRILNGAEEGVSRIDGPVFPRIGCIEATEAAKEHPHYEAPLEGENRGRGVASGFWFNVGLKSSVAINVNPDGTISLVEGSTDIGGTRASIAMQAAEVLGIPAESVYPTVVDTNSVGYTDVTGGSRTAFATGYAAYEAAQDVKQQMTERAAKLWEVDAAEVQFADGDFVCVNGKDERMSFKELAARLDEVGGPVTGRASVDPTGVGGAFATHIVDVEVDPDTGKVEILRYTATQDAGKAVHPSYVEGQMQGGVTQGIGWALNEEYIYDKDGRMSNASFLDYRMPTCLDLPMIDTVIVEVPNPGHPYGVRGVGEVPIVPPPAAIANAIYRAIGVRMKELPMSPGRILKTMGKL